MKVNLGSGRAYMQGWVNVDPDPSVKADIHAEGIEFVRTHGPEIDEVYLGHVLEHLLPGESRALLQLLCDRLRSGVQVSAVVPDMKAIFRAYRDGEISNEELNASYVYSYTQPSHHVWCHDSESLVELFTAAGFEDVESIDPLTWPPVYWKEGPESRWQCGVRALATARRSGEPASADAPISEPATPLGDPTGPETAPGTAGSAVLEVVLGRNRVLLEEVARQVASKRDLEQSLENMAATNTRLAGAAQELAQLQSSRSHALASLLARMGRRALPQGSRPRSVVRAATDTARELRVLRHRLLELWSQPGLRSPRAPSYARWSSSHDASKAELARQAREWRACGDRHSVGVIVAAAPGPPEMLEATLRSLVAQSWASWNAVVVASEGSDPLGWADGRVERADVAGLDPWQGLNSHVGLVGEVDFLLFLEAGEELAPDCMYQVAATARRDPFIDLVYWHDDLRGPDGTRQDPRFRPSWSPETLLGADYIGRAFALRRARYMTATGVRDELGASRFRDLLLRSQLDSERVTRVDRVLSHTLRRPDAPDENARRATADHLAGSGAKATVELAGDSVRIRWDLTDAPHVTVIIPTRHNRRMIEPCLRSLETTDYPSFDVIVVDNGEHRAENDAWYDTFNAIDVSVLWWTEPFNYSKVNNHAATAARGDVLVFLNDDTEVLDPSWMQEIVGWARQPEVGAVGLQLFDRAGRIQHAGVVVGLSGFADHVFQGMAPGSDTLLGPTGWYRNVSAVTGACLGMTRTLFEEIGGFDERFILCGSDVALCLDAALKGRRTVCSPFGGLRHAESATRGTHVPAEDFFTSYWRYQALTLGGDPYFSHGLSLGSRVPRLRSEHEPSVRDRLEVPLGRRMAIFKQGTDASESATLADAARLTDSDVRAVEVLHRENADPFLVHTVNWFIPDIDSPFYGGINTAFRIADHLARNHGVENRFVVLGNGPEQFVRSAVAAAFPALATAPVVLHDGTIPGMATIPAADVAISTLWLTAYALMRAEGARRKFYLVQDFEPMFYPAGTLYALTEETYRMGLYGIANTENLLNLYEGYGGTGTSFTPAVDPSVFHANGRRQWLPGTPVTVFLYARPGHWRNCWELASIAVKELKERVGDSVRIVTAGSWSPSEDCEAPSMSHLGLLDYRATGDLYRKCDVGVALTVSKHPSYLPLELMACGVPVVAFDNPHGHWILHHEHNSLLARRTVPALVDAVERLVVDSELRQRLSDAAIDDIERAHGSWEAALSGIYDYLCDPEGRSGA